jgi:hypothetical protein
MGSITSWVRLEPRCRDDDMKDAVHARIYDPLWMLARQWQTAEFQGEDTGSPVLARWRADSAPITRYYAGAATKSTTSARHATTRGRCRSKRWSSVSRSAARPAKVRCDWRSSPACISCACSMRSRCRAAIVGDFLELYALLPLPIRNSERRCRDAFLLEVDGDARIGRSSLVAAFRNAAGKRIPIPATLPIAAGDKAEVDRVINEWLAQRDSLFALPQTDAPDAWNYERLGVCILDRWGSRR